MSVTDDQLREISLPFAPGKFLLLWTVVAILCGLIALVASADPTPPRQPAECGAAYSPPPRGECGNRVMRA